MTKDESYKICVPGLFLGMGVFSLVIGSALAVWDLYDMFHGNETATVGLAILFLLIFGIPGLYLVIYGGRSVTVSGETLVARSVFMRKRCLNMGEICRVKQMFDAYVFFGEAEGKKRRLFKVYGQNPLCERLLRTLERRGVPVDSPGRVSGDEQRAALHPVPGQRFFTVWLRRTSFFVCCYIAAALFLIPVVLVCSSVSFSILLLWPFSAGFAAAAYIKRKQRLTVEAGVLRRWRIFNRVEDYTASDLLEVRLRRPLFHKKMMMRVELRLKSGGSLCRFSHPVQIQNDASHVFALLKYCSDENVPIRGLDQVDENVRCMMRRGWVNGESAAKVTQEEYRRLEHTMLEYRDRFAALNVKLAYGPLLRTQVGVLRSNDERPPLVLFEDDIDIVVESGMIFCLMRDGELLRVKKKPVPLYEGIAFLKRPGQSQTEHDLQDGEAEYFLMPIPDAVLRYLLDLFYGYVKQKKVELSGYRLAPEYEKLLLEQN